MDENDTYTPGLIRHEEKRAGIALAVSRELISKCLRLPYIILSQFQRLDFIIVEFIRKLTPRYLTGPIESGADRLTDWFQGFDLVGVNLYRILQSYFVELMLLFELLLQNQLGILPFEECGRFGGDEKLGQGRRRRLEHGLVTSRVA